jgi:RimJ/RimL family protein N-acetyltransferase
MTLPITTERLILRRFTPDDVPDLIALVSHPSVARAVPEIEPNEASATKYVEMQNGYRPFEEDKCFDLAIAQRSDDKLIGLLSLIRRKHQQTEIGWALHVDHRGRGLATEAARALISHAFRTLDQHRVHANTSSANPASWRMMERLGMRREAQLREAECRDGERSDKLIYAVLADEWQEGV